MGNPRRNAILYSSIAALAFVAWWASRPQHIDEAGAGPSVGAEDPMVAGSARLEAPIPTSVSRAAAETTITDAEATTDAIEQRRNACLLRGRVLLPGSAVAPDVAVHLAGWEANRNRLTLHGAPRDWTNPVTKTDADGRFELRFVPPRAYQYALSIKPLAHPEACWRWSELAPGEVVDLGDILLAESGTIEGELVDAAGVPPSGDWSVSAVDPREQARDNGDREPHRAQVKLDPATGRFTLPNAPVGFLRLQAWHTSQAASQAKTIEVRVGETTTVKLVYAGPRLDDRIIARLDAKRFRSLLFGEENNPRATLRGAGIELAGVHVPPSIDRVEFAGLAPGAYELSVRHPWFEDWDQAGIPTGSSVRAQLVPNARLVLEVVTAEDGDPIREHRVTASYAPEDVPVPGNGRLGSAVEVELHPLGPREMGEPLPIVPLACDLRVEAPGRSRGEILDVQPVVGGQLRLRIALGKGATVRANLSNRGTPVADAQLGICPADRFVPAPTQGQYIRPATADGARTGVTDATGSAEFAAIAPGEWVAFAQVHPQVRVHQRFVVAGDAAQAVVALELPLNGRLEGRVLGLAPDELARCTIEAVQNGASEVDQFSLRHFGWFERTRRGSSLAVEPDGSFVAPWLPQGEFDIQLASNSRQARSIGLARIVAGQTTRQDFDAALAKPGTIALRVTLSGQPAARAGVRFLVPDDAIHFDTDLVLDDSGRLQASLAPGEYLMLLQAPDGAWQTMTDTPWTVPPGGRVEHEHDVLVGCGSLQFVDADSLAPLAKTSFQLVDRHDIHTRSMTTDDQGRLELVLPVGVWRAIRSQGPGQVPWRPQPVALVDWTVGGPGQPQVKVAR